MNRLEGIVFIHRRSGEAELFTTSEVIAKYTGVQHHAIKQIITRHESDLLEFGIMAQQMPKIEGRGRPKKVYCLNEQQATLVITYLQNTAPVRAFKKELVRQFYAMRTELISRRAVRAELKPIRRELTDSIKDNPDRGQWSYRLYTDLAYKAALGKTAAQIRRERGAKTKAPAVDYMSAGELEGVSKVFLQIAVLHDLGMGYEEIRELLHRRTSLFPPVTPQKEVRA